MRLADWITSYTASNQAPLCLKFSEGSSEWQSVAIEARPFLVGAAYRANPRKILVIASSYDKCLAWEAKLRTAGVPEADIFQLPSGTSALFEDAAPEYNALSDRIGALRALVDPRPAIIIGAASAVLERTLPREVLSEAFVDLKPSETVDSGRLLAQLTGLGYEFAEPVRLPGQYSQRGGIIDIYVSGHDLPMRIELFGDEIESIRSFDPISQRSSGSIPGLSLSPSRETLYWNHDGHANPEELIEWRRQIAEMIRSTCEREAPTLNEAGSNRMESLINGDAEALEEGIFFDRLDLYRPLVHPDSGCAIDLLDENAILIMDEPLELEGASAKAEDELSQSLIARHERGEVLHSTVNDFMLPPEHLASFGHVITMSAMNALPDWLRFPHQHDLGIVSLAPYRAERSGLAETLKNWTQQEFTVLIATEQPLRAKSTLDGIGIPAFETDEAIIKPGVFLCRGNLGGGFVIPSQKFAVITDAELFGVARLRLPQKRFSEGAPIATVLDLKPGDYVVHINFGIGVFRGLAKRTIEGVDKEFLAIDYAAPDKLFVPADQLDRIQKYLNPGDSHPKLNRLAGGDWQRTIGKAKEEAKVFARDLVKLYAERRAVTRRPFGPDTPWQTEMETTFPWVETPTQMAAIKEAKADLQLNYPMDRLVCGDVGFGKTEVAIRAAFKVVQEGRQVAVLCPTTILSEQHSRNFAERLDSFGVRIGILNRFRSTKERNELLASLKDGKVDLVLGTHALLSKEVEFKDLGLVIVDEEQKFGVKQKEALKHLRVAVDVLSMSATPIPRTLSMALMDIRQMSLITDPPPGRLPIRTYLRPYAKEVVREALLRELARGGQAFYVYNRVEGIHHVAEKLQKLIPSARIGVGHGQMTEAQLEPVMIGFIRGEIDILLSTTIIENGIDIPNANTLIIEDADRLGLSQLYQLRGRVGRSDRQAYAYLLYQSHKDLNEGATQRLHALQEFSSLGSGYSLAFRDLQIRGAGELLGAKQSGAMATVGYELYSQLIEEAVRAIKSGVDGAAEKLGDAVDPMARREPLPMLELPVIALIPDSYIKDQAQRLYYYQQMMAARTPAELGEASAEVEDRYGHPPEPVRNAFAIMHYRMVARDLEIEKIDGMGGRLAVSFKDRTKVPPRAFMLLQRRSRDCYVTRDQLIWPYSGAPINAVETMLRGFKECLAQVEEERAALA
ncbi:MAG: transcription-repair coupling factor [Fimbriimonadaceae bacterium]